MCSMSRVEARKNEKAVVETANSNPFGAKAGR